MGSMSRQQGTAGPGFFCPGKLGWGQGKGWLGGWQPCYSQLLSPASPIPHFLHKQQSRVGMGIENTAPVIQFHNWAVTLGGQAHSPAARTFRNPLQEHDSLSHQDSSIRNGETVGSVKTGKPATYDRIETVLLLTLKAVTMEKITLP